jgi:alpha-amylase/alpha-mannosidase (GH57 family)
MERYICIHGHFYQPPRENPWLEDVETQDSAYPYHDWNERISAECYEPNTVSRILDNKHLIRKIVNNYARISFNFGPTLLDWLEKNEPAVYQAIIEADRESRLYFSGHGSALAQAYNHMIMPLANRRDKITQVIWGIRDFTGRFGRLPGGMWLPETAVDLETLDIMAEQGIKFTILAPYQARRVRKIGTGHWHEVGPGGIDPSMAYLQHLPSGRSINIFFYDGPISSAVAFERLLSSGEHFAHRLLSGFNKERAWPQLVNIATDGETYGHHHRHGDMALAYALNYIGKNNLARITNYSEHLADHPPTHEVEIKENTAWSCAHGVDRWQADCGCNSGFNAGTGQAWRTPLRSALNWLRNTLAPLYEKQAGRYLKDPWEARNDYITVIRDRSDKNLRLFLNKHAVRDLEPEEVVTVLKLLEVQRNAMLMYTSCGWFFDDISGIETVQIIQYAGRVIHLAKKLFDRGPEIESRFLEMLVLARSNKPGQGTAADIYHKSIRHSAVDLKKLGAHYAICSLFESFDLVAKIYCYTIERQDYHLHVAGRTQVTVGRIKVTSEITRETATLTYGVLYFGYHNLTGGVRVYHGEEPYREMVQGVAGAFERADFGEVYRLLNQYFEGMNYSLKQLFLDKQRNIVNLILESTLADTESEYGQIYERHATLMRYLKNLGNPQPKALQCAADLVLNTNLQRAFASEAPDIDHINGLLREARHFNVKFDQSLAYVLEGTIEQLAEKFRDSPADLSLLRNLKTYVDLTRSLPFEINLNNVQNIYYNLLQTLHPDLRPEQQDEHNQEWVRLFTSLGEKLRMSPTLLSYREPPPGDYYPEQYPALSY